MDLSCRPGLRLGFLDLCTLGALGSSNNKEQVLLVKSKTELVNLQVPFFVNSAWSFCLFCSSVVDYPLIPTLNLSSFFPFLFISWLPGWYIRRYTANILLENLM